MKSNKISKLFISIVISGIIFLNGSIVFAYNSSWSAQSIANFLDNKIDASNVLRDEKYHENITREEFAELIIAVYAIANKIDKNSIPIKENPFTDTNSIDVQKAYSLGIVNGISKNKYSPKSEITREEIATIIARFLNIQEIKINISGNLNDFTDEKSVSAWAYESMVYCVENEILKGVGYQFDVKLNPKQLATVQEVVIMLDRVGLKNNWIKESKNIYINGFFIPKDTKIYTSSYNDGMYIEIPWSNIDDIEKVKKDLQYILNHKIKNTDELNKLIIYILDAKKEVFKEFNIDGYTINVVDIEECPYLQIYPKH